MNRGRTALSTAVRCFLDSWIWMAYAFGPVPPEIITRRDDTARSSLSRAERREWASLVRQLR